MTALPARPPAAPDAPAADAARDRDFAEKTAKIAIVDDEPVNVKVVRKHLQIAGYANFVTTTDSRAALALIREERPDVVLLDVMMPEVDGIQILQAVRRDPRVQHTPVLILTASTDSATKLRALNAGATDFLAKPVDASELVPRLRNALIVKAHHDHLASYSEQLEREVRLRTVELEASRLQVVHSLARAAEYRDDTTGRHVLRVGRYAAILARELGFGEADAAMLGLAAQLHDVGKIGLPDAILLKPGKLTPEEYEVVKRHCEIGHGIVQPRQADDGPAAGPDHDGDGDGRQSSGQAGKPAPQSSDVAADRHPLLSMAARIARSHHERWDGAGYPRGLAGEAIPIEGRITAVADVFDALSTPRPYKPAYPPEQCFEMLRAGRGTQFDPAVLDALFRKTESILAVYREQADGPGDAAGGCAARR